MKNLFYTLMVVAGISFLQWNNPVYAAETTKVCVDVKDKAGQPVKDSKTGKVKQACKEMKVHKKLEGTEVPQKK
jgi:hypothetical protein